MFTGLFLKVYFAVISFMAHKCWASALYTFIQTGKEGEGKTKG